MLMLVKANVAIAGHVRAGHFVQPHSRIKPIAFNRAVSSDRPGTLKDDQFIPYKEYRGAIKDTYFGDGQSLSSRTTRQRRIDLPLGVWREDEYKIGRAHV